MFASFHKKINFLKVRLSFLSKFKLFLHYCPIKSKISISFSLGDFLYFLFYLFPKSISPPKTAFSNLDYLGSNLFPNLLATPLHYIAVHYFLSHPIFSYFFLERIAEMRGERERQASAR